jgi:pyridoxine 5-phosphate synthase
MAIKKFAVACYDDEEVLFPAVKKVRSSGYKLHDVYTPFPVHGLDHALGHKETAIIPYKNAALLAHQLGMGINAGHDLDRFNLPYLIQQISIIDEVSIGHALISDALYLGLENTIQLYKRALIN